MFILTGFADEAALELTDQIALLTRLGISHVEFRSAWGTKVLDLSKEQLRHAKALLDDAGISLSSVGSDIGKIPVTDPFDEHVARAAHAVEVAQFFGTGYIRMFSFFIPHGADPADYRDEVMERTAALVRLAEAGGVTLLHENEKHIYGDVPDRVVDLVQTMNSNHYRSIFDPANYVQCGVRPMDDAYPTVREFTDYVHIKDASATELDAHGLNRVLPAGQGDGHIPELVAALNESGYEGFLSIEPHLGDFDAFGGLCGPDLWTTAYNALIGVFTAQGIEWR